jgi:hypothetical protein
MKRKLFTVAALIAGTACAGEFGGVIKATSGFKADFKSPSASGVYANDPGALAPDTDHEYDNGYVRDNLLSAGATPDWGFNSKSQVTPAVGGFNFGATIDFSSSRTIGSGVNKSADQDGLEPGFELFYRDMPWKGERSSLGWMAGLTYQRVGVESRGSASFATETTTDTYTYLGVFPNVGNPLFPAPYDNTDPTLLLPDGSTRTVTAGTLAYQYNREINADLFGVKLGPVWELHLMNKLSLVTAAGVSLQWINSEFSYTDGANSGTTTDSGVLFGAYAQGDLEYAVTDRWRLFAGIEWGTQESFSQSVDGYDSELQGVSLISGRLGVAVSF